MSRMLRLTAHISVKCQYVCFSDSEANRGRVDIVGNDLRRLFNSNAHSIVVDRPFRSKDDEQPTN